MFYCTKCAIENNWPETFFKSIGKCERCGKKCECNDKPSSELPAPEISDDISIYGTKYQDDQI